VNKDGYITVGICKLKEIVRMLRRGTFLERRGGEGIYFDSGVIKKERPEVLRPRKGAREGTEGFLKRRPDFQFQRYGKGAIPAENHDNLAGQRWKRPISVGGTNTGGSPWKTLSRRNCVGTSE